jgi:serine/threonine protein kinase
VGGGSALPPPKIDSEFNIFFYILGKHFLKMSANSDSSSVEPTSPQVFGNVPVRHQNPKDLYEFGKMRSRGSSGRVYPVFCKLSHKKFAIKRMTESDDILMENMVWSAIPNHPNIVGLIEVFIWQNKVYSVMELGSACLTNIIPIRERYSPMLPPDVVLKIIRQIILAVYHLHTHKFSHGDLKCDNVMIMLDGTIKIVDFGVTTRNGEIYHTSPLCGTFSWKSPNSMSRDTADQFPDDVWALGITIGEIVGMDPPFLDQARDIHRIIQSIRNLQAPPALPDLKCYGEDFERKIHAILSSCLKLTPSERLTAQQLLEVFDGKN